jgi:UDPglucose 6-dehydrogenase
MGHVGRAMHRLFARYDPGLYDPNIAEYSSPDHQRAARETDLRIVCVPTPQSKDGSCDTSIVEAAVSESGEHQLVLIKSTVTPGTSTRLAQTFGRTVCFSPEYWGESTFAIANRHQPEQWPFVIVGGEPDAAHSILSAFSTIMGPDKIYRSCSAEEAELCKYMENSWLALQVLFANQFASLAEGLGLSYLAVRELWALDPRVSRWHSLAFEDDQGFGGKCLPKDVSAIEQFAQSRKLPSALLTSMLSINNGLRAEQEVQP